MHDHESGVREPRPADAAGAAPMQAPPLVRFEAVSKRFGTFTALDRVSLDIRAGEFFALLGPSGCGKTTLLRMLAGLEEPDGGRILLDGRDLAGVPPHRRPVNMMFQSYALFPHLTVGGNVAFGLKQDRLPRAEIEARVHAMLSLVQLEGFAARKPQQLSGGQRQRVALARALAKRPRVLLLDEPMAALDRKLRQTTQFELKALQAKLGLTFVIVTHDQEEAMTVADRIGVMRSGALVQVGTPGELYEQPNSRWVAGFVGEINLIESQVSESSALGGGAAGGTRLASAALGAVRVAQPSPVAPGGKVWIALRPEKLRLVAPGGDTGSDNAADATVAEVGYLGGFSTFKLRLAEGTLLRATAANAQRQVALPVGAGDPVRVAWAPDAAILLAE